MSFASIFNRRIFFLTALLLLGWSKLFATNSNTNDMSNIYTYAPTKTSSGNWVVTADFLAWFASEEVASIWADVITIGNNTSSWEALGFNFNWDYGFRIGAGYSLFDNWDTKLQWTWFSTDAKHTIPFKPNATISPEFFAAFLSGDTPQSMRAKWSLLFNMFDWELGRSFWISKSLSLRPFIGIKGGWINQSIHGEYDNLTIDKVLTKNSGRNFLKNNFRGVGALGGIDTKWQIRNFGSHFFDFFGDFSLSTMWGNWHCSDRYENTASKTSSVNMKNSTLGALMFRGFMGIEWNVDFSSCKSHFATKLGYEMQIWLNQLRFATFQLQRLHDDLTLQGITLNCRLDF